VQVGPRGALVFEPPEVSASMGDVIRFNFVSGNHTATQSSLEQPCVANGGFDTGFISVGDGMPRHVDYIVDTDQAWFHCRQADHCARGMVFAVNPG
ncbi:Cupredoxin, partial [Plectosphaerella cucumerina]